jgi:hypothetical protein
VTGGLGANPRQTKNVKRSVAGPSSKPPSKNSLRGRGKAATDASESSGVEEVSPNTLSKPQRGKRANNSNGQTAKGKGKGKATPKSSRNKSPDVQLIDDTDAEAIAESLLGTNSRPPPKNDREIARLQQKLAQACSPLFPSIIHRFQAEKQIVELRSKLEEILRTKMTEPEMLLNQAKEQYENHLESWLLLGDVCYIHFRAEKDQLIKKLTESLAAKEPLLESGKISAVELLTREAADAEKRLVEKELVKWRELAAQKEDVIRDKTQIGEHQPLFVSSSFLHIL